MSAFRGLQVPSAVVGRCGRPSLRSAWGIGAHGPTAPFTRPPLPGSPEMKRRPASVRVPTRCEDRS